jgi:hypothetical protein
VRERGERERRSDKTGRGCTDSKQGTHIIQDIQSLRHARAQKQEAPADES